MPWNGSCLGFFADPELVLGQEAAVKTSVLWCVRGKFYFALFGVYLGFWHSGGCLGDGH